MTNAQLVQTLARALRAAADELERAGDVKPKSPAYPKRDPVEITELTRRRAQSVLERLKMG